MGVFINRKFCVCTTTHETDEINFTISNKTYPNHEKIVKSFDKLCRHDLDQFQINKNNFSGVFHIVKNYTFSIINGIYINEFARESNQNVHTISYNYSVKNSMKTMKKNSYQYKYNSNMYSNTYLEIIKEQIGDSYIISQQENIQWDRDKLNSLSDKSIIDNELDEHNYNYDVNDHNDENVLNEYVSNVTLGGECGSLSEENHLNNLNDEVDLKDNNLNFSYPSLSCSSPTDKKLEHFESDACDKKNKKSSRSNISSFKSVKIQQNFISGTTFPSWKCSGSYLRSLLDPEKVLNMKNDDIIIQSEMLKLSTDIKVINSRDTQSYAYTSKFCLLTKTHFKYYNSKEAFLRMINPSLILPINSIELCSIDESFLKDAYIKKRNIKENEKIFHMLIKVKSINYPNSATTNKLALSNELSLRGFYQTNRINMNLTEIVPFKKSLVENKSIQGNKKKKFNNLLIFASNNLNLINSFLRVYEFLLNLV